MVISAAPIFQELEFFEHDHIYRLNGVEIPSVSALMEPLSQKHYGGIDPDILAAASRRGTIVHNAIENFVQFGVEDIEPAYAGYLEAFKKWWSFRKPEVLGTECRVYHKILRYAGTEDLVCRIGGRIALVDYKTSASVNSMLCGVQLEGYDRAYESHGFNVDTRLILHLKRNGSFEEIEFPRTSELFTVLSALLTIRKYENKF